MTSSTSYWNSPFLIASCLGATFFVFGSILVFGVYAGQKKHAREWRPETATVVRSVRLCEMSYRRPFNPFMNRRRSPRAYLEVIDCKDLKAYLDANRDRYTDLRADQSDYLDIGYPAIKNDTRRVPLEKLSETPLAVGDEVPIRVHPKIPSRIEKISTERDFWKDTRLLTMLSLVAFGGSWGWIVWEGKRAKERRPTWM